MAAVNSSNDSNLSNASNVSAVPACTRSLSCCEREVRAEAKLACQGFKEFAIGLASDQNCKFWEDYAAQACQSTCADCEKIAKEIYSSCLFLLQTVMSFVAARPHCVRTERSFRYHRCPSACIDKISNCYTPEFDRCNALCGNYNYAPGVSRDGCVCVQLRNIPGMPDECTGQTILSGPIPGRRGLKHDCRLIPDDCKNHRPTTCGFYKHCPVDVCVVMNVTCPPLDSCQSDGVCNPGDGQCYYQPKADGDPCDDGLDWTRFDTCSGGRCTGLPNYCKRDNITCASANNCLVATDKTPRGCDPGTGHCVFEVHPDGTPCASQGTAGAGLAADGICSAGLCRRPAATLNPCRNVTCPQPSQCHEVPACHPDRGCAVAAPHLPEGSPCSDGDPGTRGDRCIEGRCVGDPVPQPQYSELGLCGGQPPRSGGLLLPWRRYSADVPDFQACQDQCDADPECRALAHGYQTCSIFGTGRLASPDPLLSGRHWVVETAPAQPTYSVECFEKGTERSSSLTPEERTLVALSICMVVLVPLAFVLTVGRKPLRRSLARLLPGSRASVVTGTVFEETVPGAGGGGAKVAAAPPPPTELPPLEAAPPGNEALASVPDPRGEVQIPAG